MKTSNVILGIFLWICIPLSMILGAIFSYSIFRGSSNEMT